MEILAADPAAERARIDWLIRLRWVAVLGVLGAVIMASFVLGLLVDPLPLFILVTGLATWNLYLQVRVRRDRSVLMAGQQVVIDLCLLGALLYFSRGLRNPFSMFLAVQVMLGAILLPRRTAVNVGLVGMAITVALAILEFSDLLPASNATFELPVWGLGLALVLALAVALQLVVMVMEDLRERAKDARRFHEQAERERRKLFDVVRFVGAAMVLLDRELKTEWQNKRSEDVLGALPPGEPFRFPGGAPWPPRGALSESDALEGEWTGKDVHGHERVHHVTASPVRNDLGEIEQVILVFTDITDRRAAELQLQRTEKLAALGRLAAGVAHEINTPLGSVSILTSEAITAAQDIGDAGARAELEESLTDIKQETERVAHLVRRLLELSHPGGEAVSETDPDQVAEDAIRLISVRSPRSRARIEADFAGTLTPVETNPDRLRQVLLNLLDNALDATRSTDGSVLVRTMMDGASPVIEVEDTGEGIAQDDLERVFDPFFTTKDVGEGTGLGLYVSYEIMKNLGGDITIDSRPGEGTRVRLTLPAVRPSNEGLSTPTAP